jgi:hypothetical protein
MPLGMRRSQINRETPGPLGLANLSQRARMRAGWQARQSKCRS